MEQESKMIFRIYEPTVELFRSGCNAESRRSGEMRAESDSRRIQIQFLMQREKLSGAEWETNQIKYFLGELLMTMQHTFNIYHANDGICSVW